MIFSPETERKGTIEKCAGHPECASTAANMPPGIYKSCVISAILAKGIAPN
jgi:hypothetical protein